MRTGRAPGALTRWIVALTLAGAVALLAPTVATAKAHHHHHHHANKHGHKHHHHGHKHHHHGKSNVLPPAAAVPPGSPAQAAQTLARQILSGGRPGIAALETALRLSGIGIVYKGKVIQKPSRPGAGVSVDATELAGEVVLAQRSQRIALSELLSTVGTSVGVSHPNLLTGRQAVLSDLQSAAGSSAATVSFLAHVMDDISPQAGLLRSGGATDPQLNPLQAYLLQYMWVGALHSFFATPNGQAQRALSAPTAVASSGAPCQPDERAEQITDVAGNAFGMASDSFREWVLDEAGSAAKMASKVASSINSLLILAKFGGLDAALKGSIELVGGKPLQRTKEQAQPGENRVLKASFRLDFGALQHAANCTKLVAAMLGIDVASQNDGPVKDAEADWFINDQPGSGGSGALANPVQYYSLGGGASATKTSTDESGETRAGLQGKPQRVKLPENPTPYTRNVVVGLSLTVNKNNLRKDLPGLIGAGVTGNVIAAISGALDHMGLFTATKTIQVEDWYADYLVDFSSAEVLRPTSGSGQFNYLYKAKPEITPDSSGAVSGETAGDYAQANGTITGDDGTSATIIGATPDAFDVVDFDAGNEQTAPSIVIAPNLPSESYHAHDPNGADYDFDNYTWLGLFKTFHPSLAGQIKLPLQSVGDGGANSVVARGTFSKTIPDGNGGTSEQTQVTVTALPPPKN